MNRLLVTLGLLFAIFAFSLLCGVAIWVFAPIMPAALLFIVAWASTKRKPAKREQQQREDEIEYRKAA
jgi:hypothetical protein